MNFSKILSKFKNYNLIPILLYALSVFIIFKQVVEVFYIYIHNKGSVVYNPYLFTLYILIPTCAFLTILSSDLIPTSKSRLKAFIFSFICIEFITFGMLTQFSNEYIWVFILSVKSKLENIPPDIIENAIRALTFYLPIIVSFVFFGFFAKLLGQRDFHLIFPKLELSLNSAKMDETGPLTCEVTVCIDAKTNKPIVVPESKRMESTLIQGATGTGKTATLLLPMGAIDLERKYFFRELGKELAYKALQKGYAYVDAPLSNEALNNNFSLKYINPIKGKEALFEKELKDMIKYKNPDTSELIFRDLGIAIVDNDGEYAQKFRNIASNFGIDCVILDPLHEDTAGLNPFVYSDPVRIASVISSVLKGMYESENPADSNLFFAQVTQQAIENLSILLKIMYPKMHDGMLPTLEDMLEMLHNYDIVEEMTEEMKKDLELSHKYKTLIVYFEKNFYKPALNDRGFPIPGSRIGSGRKVTEQFLYGAVTQLDNLLRDHSIKKILCSRTNNINLKDVLRDGTCLTVCTRRGPLGSLLSKAFGQFFILIMQSGVLQRPGTEKTRTPYFLYIDEFPDFVNKETETCFTLFRKYRCALIVAIQNLSQLERTKSMAFYKKVVVANTKTQIIFGDTNVEDSEYWSEAFGKVIMWTWHSQLGGNPDGYSESFDQGFSWEPQQAPVDIHYQPFKCIKYKTKNASGKTIIGDGKTNFVDNKYYEQHPIKSYNFDKYKVHSPSSEETEREPAPQYDSISTSFNQVDEQDFVQSDFQPENIEEPNISLGENIQADIENDKLSTEEMHALKELITDINKEDKQPYIDDSQIEIGQMLTQQQAIPIIDTDEPEPFIDDQVEKTKPSTIMPDPEPVIKTEEASSDIIDIEPLEEDKAENPDVLDKMGKIKIEVNQN